MQGNMNTVEQDYREAYLNEELARSWEAGERWAAVDLHGLHMTDQHCQQHHVSCAEAPTWSSTLYLHMHAWSQSSQSF